MQPVTSCPTSRPVPSQTHNMEPFFLRFNMKRPDFAVITKSGAPPWTYNTRSRRSLAVVGDNNEFTFNYGNSAGNNRQLGVFILIKFFL